MIKVLNLYAGVGGNRKLWKGAEVTAIESNATIAGVYKKLFPKDQVLIQDAHVYLLKNYSDFDFIWSSVPCVSHTRLNWMRVDKVFPDLKLYEEILFLHHHFKGLWVVENVIPYYKPLIPPRIEMSNHLFWSNFEIKRIEKYFTKLSGKESHSNMKERIYYRNKWLGMDLKAIDFPKLRFRQIVDNTLHPEIGLGILKSAFPNVY